MDFILNCFSKTPAPESEGPTKKEAVAATAAPAPPPPPPPKLTFAILLKQDAKTSATIIRLLEKNPDFVAFAEFEAEDILARDEEDANKLAAGVQISIEKGILAAMERSPEYLNIDVIGKTPDQICDIIIRDMGKAATEGGVLVLCGLSGTGPPHARCPSSGRCLLSYKLHQFRALPRFKCCLGLLPITLFSLKKRSKLSQGRGPPWPRSRSGCPTLSPGPTATCSARSRSSP